LSDLLALLHLSTRLFITGCDGMSRVRGRLAAVRSPTTFWRTIPGVSWIDVQGNLWPSGGLGKDSTGNRGDLNDLNDLSGLSGLSDLSDLWRYSAVSGRG
jgi:hypothetical protein